MPDEHEEQKIKSKFKLKKLVKTLEAIKGRHTELVTVYVPAGYSLIEIISQLRTEQSTAENIKSKQVRKNVTTALDKIIRYLQLYKRTPENGLALFCGNVSEKEGAANIELWAIEPPDGIKVKMYWCDQRFVLDPLLDMIEEKEIYGIICLDKSEADIALLKGKKIEPLFHKESIVPGKTRAGGQCLLPTTMVVLANGNFKQIKDIKIGDKLKSYDFRKKTFTETTCIDKWSVRKNKLVRIKAGKNEIISSAEHIFFLADGTQKVADELESADILLADKSKLQIDFIESFNEKRELIDISVNNENFIANGLIVHNSSARFSRVREGMLNDWLKQVAEAANKIFEEHKEVKGILLGGSGPVKEMFLKEEYMHADVQKKILGTVDTSYTGEHGLEETLVRGEDLIKELAVTKEKNLLQKFLTELQKPHGLAVYGMKDVMRVLELGAVDMVIISENIGEVEDEDAIEYFEEKTKNYGTTLVVVSADTREGRQFRALGGIGALLRYHV